MIVLGAGQCFVYPHAFLSPVERQLRFPKKEKTFHWSTLCFHHLHSVDAKQTPRAQPKSYRDRIFATAALQQYQASEDVVNLLTSNEQTRAILLGRYGHSEVYGIEEVQKWGFSHVKMQEKDEYFKFMILLFELLERCI